MNNSDLLLNIHTHKQESIVIQQHLSMRACAISVNSSSRSSLCIVNIFYSPTEHRERAHINIVPQTLCELWALCVQAIYTPGQPLCWHRTCWKKNDWIVQLHVFTSNARAHGALKHTMVFEGTHRMHTHRAIYARSQRCIGTCSKSCMMNIAFIVVLFLFWTINKSTPCLSGH
jgi:hypothetical protein